jgi:hypothetical protein
LATRAFFGEETGTSEIGSSLSINEGVGEGEFDRTFWS